MYVGALYFTQGVNSSQLLMCFIAVKKLSLVQTKTANPLGCEEINQDVTHTLFNTRGGRLTPQMGMFFIPEYGPRDWLL
jgi:hypothetical protein